MSEDITANYHGGHPRSVEAHEATKPRKNADYSRILTLLHAHPYGLTCDEAEQLLGMRHQTCSARFSGHEETRLAHLVRQAADALWR